MLDPDLLIAVLFGLTVAGYLLFVNRKHQHYKGRFILDVPIENAWDLLSTTPGTLKGWLPQLISVEWTDESARELVCRYEGGHESYVHIIDQAAPFYEETVSVQRLHGARRSGDRIFGQMRLTSLEEGTEVELHYKIQRGDLPSGFFRRIGYPTLASTVGKLVRGYLARERETIGQDIRLHASKPRQEFLMPQTLKHFLLMVLSFAAMALLLGPVPGIAIIATIIVHECGHVLALRRHGHDARFYLIPIFGGITIGSRTFISDAEAGEVFLMGPALGLLPALACLGVFWVAPSKTWMTAGFVALMTNGFNLLPVPPLDGGRVVQSFLKPLGDKIWFAVSGLLILLGAGLAAQVKSKTLLVMFIVSAILWSLAPRRSRSERPLNMMEGFVTMAAYLTLIIAHVAVAFWCDSFFKGHLLRSMLQL